MCFVIIGSFRDLVGGKDEIFWVYLVLEFLIDLDLVKFFRFCFRGVCFYLRWVVKFFEVLNIFIFVEW